MQGRHTRRWYNAIPVTGRFHIMLVILLLSEAAIVGGCLRAMDQHTEAGWDLAQVAAVQRALDQALTIHSDGASKLQGGAAGTAADFPRVLRAQLDAVWALPATPEVNSITDSLRQPALQYLETVEAHLRPTAGSGNGTDWAFASLEPRRIALENALTEAMNRMRDVLHRVETRVIAEAGRSSVVTAWVIGGG